MKKISSSFPFLYLEHGVVFRKDSDIIFKNKQSENVIPLDSFVMLLFGPGISFSSNAVSHMSRNDCFIGISSSDQMPKVFLTTFSTIGNPEYSIKQIEIYNNRHKKLNAARYLIKNKFDNNTFLSKDSFNNLMLSEARHTKIMYKDIFGKSFVRDYKRDSDHTNMKINIANNAIYNYCAAIIHLMGFSPHIGILHGKKRNALIFDFSELFKTKSYYKIINDHTEIRETLFAVSKYCHTNQTKLMEYIKYVFGEIKESEDRENEDAMDSDIKNLLCYQTNN